MEETTVISEKEQFTERLYGWLNDALTFFENHKIIAFLSLIVVVALVAFLVCNKHIESIGPIKFNKRVGKKQKKKKIKRQITYLPGPRPLNCDAKLPLELENILQDLKEGKRKRILIKNDNRCEAEEIGKLLYHRLNQKNICDYVGWINYNIDKPGHKTMEECIEQEFSIFKHIKDYDIRKSKRLDFLDDLKKHCVLFVNVVSYCETEDYDISRYNNFDGLSVILMSEYEINGYETYLINKKGVKSLCDSMK